MRKYLSLLAVTLILSMLLLPLTGFGEEESSALTVTVRLDKKNYIHGETVNAFYEVTGGSGEYTEITASWEIGYSAGPVNGDPIPLTESSGTLSMTQKKGDKIRLNVTVTDSNGETVTASSSRAPLGRTFFEWVGFLLEEYGPLFWQGTLYTLLIALVGTIAGFLIGLLVAILRTIPLPEKYVRASGIRRFLLRLLSWVLSVYIEVFRGTPMMVQAMVIYYGLSGLGLKIPTLPAALFIVSINTGAYMAEIIRGGIISVDKGQKEGAHAIGLSHWQCMVRVVLPQAVRNIMPSIGNEFVVNIKDSSVLNVISVSELFFISKSAAGTYLRYFEVFFITAIIYLILTFTITRLLRLLERKMDGKANYTICGSQSDSESAIPLKKEDVIDA